jgi:hypothetical protein
LKEGNHFCGLDNLYNSTKFAREAYAGKTASWFMVLHIKVVTGSPLASCNEN